MITNFNQEILTKYFLLFTTYYTIRKQQLPARKNIPEIKSVLFTKFNSKKVLCDTQVYYYCRNKLVSLMNAIILNGLLTINSLILFTAQTVYKKI